MKFRGENMLRFMTAGESHGKTLTGILEGIPAGLKIDIDSVNNELKRRQCGYGRGGRMKIESDTAEIVSGVRFGETIGSPIAILIKNRDNENWLKKMAAFGEPYGEKVTAARPGHADLNGVLKYDRVDARDILERSSARETAMRVAVGGICKNFLEVFGINIFSHVISLGGVLINRNNIAFNKSHTTDSELNVFDQNAEAKMKAKIDEAKNNGDTLGGVFEIIIKGAPVGLGSHISFESRLDAKFAAALMSIQAIKGVEIGEGFELANLPGSLAHDEIFLDDDGKPFRKTNRAGGIEGGMTNGEDIVLRCAMKPIPTLMQPLNSIDIETKSEIKASKERSDVTAVPAASVVGEAMSAYVMAGAILEMFGGAAMTDTLQNYRAYVSRINSRWSQ
ncbi:MAG: chorismate synthase [Selenomonadaceae bacterium]|nr:chorismate synthase [Selenomonadaceae bacterium]